MNQSQWAPQPEADEERPSALSAVATPFSPSAPPPDVSSVDYFAQTGASQDDLFDGITPISDSMRVRSEDDLFNEDFTPVAEPVIEQSIPQRSRGRGDGQRGRVRARARGAISGPRGNGAANTQPRYPQQTDQGQPPQDSSPPENAPTGPRKDTTPSVRGNRQATGGPAKPRLTEEELAEKMQRIQLKNASLTAAHARSEADAASFAKREEQAQQVAAQRQKEDRRDRQQMMGERERNRMRKLKAMEGREWDAEKNEDDFQRGGRHDKRGGFGGNKEDYTDGREYLYREPRGSGRGNRGAARERKVEAQSAPRQEDFPALPAPNSAAIGQNAVNHDAVKSWADQVELSNS